MIFMNAGDITAFMDRVTGDDNRKQDYSNRVTDDLNERELTHLHQQHSEMSAEVGASKEASNAGAFGQSSAFRASVVANVSAARVGGVPSGDRGIGGGTLGRIG